jgi:hypothetical protein
MDREAETEIDREPHRLGELSRRFTVNVQDLIDTILYAFRDDLDKAVAYCKQGWAGYGPRLCGGTAYEPHAGKNVINLLSREPMSPLPQQPQQLGGGTMDVTSAA